MDNINVVIRVRPLLECEKSKSVCHWECQENSIHQIDEKTKPLCAPYLFNRVFGSSTNSELVFEEVARPILRAVMDGYNGSIFAYGQTASGKTYTMMGSERNRGLIPRMVQSIFDAIENTPDRGFLLRVSYMEIYNERVYDLLSNNRKSLNIREDANAQPFVENLKAEVASSMADIMTLMRIGEKNRTFGATAVNPNSSRSHAIFRIIIESGVLVNNENEGPVIATGDLSSGDADLMVSHLNLIDLAGSERTGQVAIGDKFREGCSINTSLLALRNVISRLSQGTNDGSFINYRDSKLTRILQASLGGNARTSIICTVNPSMIDETHSTLKFASMAKCIKIAPTRNVVVSEATLLKQYANEISDLQKQLQSQKKENLNQEMMKQQLEETSLRNKELEERISKMKESVITSSVLCSAQQRLRRETWGGFQDFCLLSKVLNQTPSKSSSENDFFNSAFSSRSCHSSVQRSDFPIIPCDFGVTTEDFGCQVDFHIEERKLKAKVRLLQAQAAFESEKLEAMEREHTEQMSFILNENKITEEDNQELKSEIEALKKQIEDLKNHHSFDALNYSEVNTSLGLVPEVERQKSLMLLPLSESELLERISCVSKDLETFRQRSVVAEEEVRRLEQVHASYRIKMEKSFEDLTQESDIVKKTVLKLKTELESSVEQQRKEKKEWRNKVTDLEIIVENVTMKLTEKDEELNQLKEEVLEKEQSNLKEVKELKQQLHHAEGKELDVGTSEIEELKRKLHEAEVRICDLTEESRQILVEKEELEVKFQECQKNLKEQLHQADCKILELNEKLEQFCVEKEEKLKQLKEDVLKKEQSNLEEVKELKQQLQHGEEKELDVGTSEILSSKLTEIEELKQKFHEAEVRIRDLTEELRQILVEKEELEVKSEEFQKNLKEQLHHAEEKELDVGTSEIEELKRKFHEAEVRIRDLTEELRQISVAKEELEVKSSDEIQECQKNLKEQLCQADSKILELNGKLEQFCVEKQEMKIKIDEKDLKLNDFEDMRQQFHQAECKLFQLNEDLEQVLAKNEELSRMISEKNAEIDILRTNQDETEDLKRQIQQSEVKMLELNEVLKLYDAGIQKSKKFSVKPAVETEELNMVVEEKAELEASVGVLDTKQDNFEELKLQIQHLEMRILELTEELKQNCAEKVELKEKVDLKIVETESLNGKIEELKDENKNLAQKLTEVEGFNSELNKMCEEITTELEKERKLKLSLQQRVDKVVNKHSDVVDKLEVAKINYQELVLIYEEKDVACFELKNQISDMKNELKTRKKQEKYLNQKLQELEEFVTKNSSAVLEQERTQREKLEKEFEKHKLQLVEDRKNYLSKLKEFTDRSVEFEEEKSALEIRISRLTSNVERLEKECSNLRIENRRLQKRLDESVINFDKSETKDDGKCWDGTCVSGSGTATLLKVEQLEREKKALLKQLSEGCKRCQHLRKVITTKRKQYLSPKSQTENSFSTKVNRPILTESKVSNVVVEDEAEDEIEEEENFSPLRPLTTWQNDNKPILTLTKNKNDSVKVLEKEKDSEEEEEEEEENWSPLKPMVTWANTSKPIFTPQNICKYKASNQSPWARAKSWSQARISTELKPINESPTLKKSKISTEFEENQHSNTFISEKDCKVQ